jgi:hypothetical protein
MMMGGMAACLCFMSLSFLLMTQSGDKNNKGGLFGTILTAPLGIFGGPVAGALF